MQFLDNKKQQTQKNQSASVKRFNRHLRPHQLFRRTTALVVKISLTCFPLYCKSCSVLLRHLKAPRGCSHWGHERGTEVHRWIHTKSRGIPSQAAEGWNQTNMMVCASSWRRFEMWVLIHCPTMMSASLHNSALDCAWQKMFFYCTKLTNVSSSSWDKWNTQQQLLSSVSRCLQTGEEEVALHSGRHGPATTFIHLSQDRMMTSSICLWTMSRPSSDNPFTNIKLHRWTVTGVSNPLSSRLSLSVPP